MITKAPRKKSKAMRYLEKIAGGPLTFAAVIESTRLGEEMSMVAFAEKLDISVSHLNDIEKGRKFVSAERAAHFAKILGYSKEQYIRLALQDQLTRARLRYVVTVKKAAA